MIVRTDSTPTYANSVPDLKAYFTKSRLMVFGFCPAGATRKMAFGRGLHGEKI
jgi:hypothetical protein